MAGNDLLSGKVAIVTGATSPLGAAIATKFVKQGASKVILMDTSKASCENLEASINNIKKDTAIAMPYNDSDPIVKIIKDAVEKVMTQHGQLDIFYHSAAVTNVYSRYSTINMTSFKHAMEANVETIIASIEHAGNAMRRNPGGSSGCILCTGSTVGLLGDALPSAYSISKAAVIDVVRAAAAEMEKDNVRVNAISPHGIAGALDEDAMKQIIPFADNQQLKKMSTMTVEDVANMAVYLASKHGEGINGQNIVLNGRFNLSRF